MRNKFRENPCTLEDVLLIRLIGRLNQFQKLIQIIRRLGGSVAKPLFQRGSGI